MSKNRCLIILIMNGMGMFLTTGMWQHLEYRTMRPGYHGRTSLLVWRVHKHQWPWPWACCDLWIWQEWSSLGFTGTLCLIRIFKRNNLSIWYNLQWSLTYPDTFVPKPTVRITENPDRWVTFNMDISVGSQTCVWITE